VSEPWNLGGQLDLSLVVLVTGRFVNQPQSLRTNGSLFTSLLVALSLSACGLDGPLDAPYHTIRLARPDGQSLATSLTMVTEAEVSDIDAKGSPEIWVYVTSAGSGSYGFLAAYSANNKKSLSEIYLPPVSQNAKAAKGYMGHDEFRVVENTFVQRFPLYREGDRNAAPSGAMRQLQYKLVPGEAGWVLKLDKVVEY
jgi:predicted small lipoprotein YifL